MHHGVHILHPKGKIKREVMPTVLYLGRISKDKGITDALIAFISIKKNIPSSSFMDSWRRREKRYIEKIIKYY